MYILHFCSTTLMPLKTSPIQKSSTLAYIHCLCQTSSTYIPETGTLTYTNTWTFITKKNLSTYIFPRLQLLTFRSLKADVREAEREHHLPVPSLPESLAAV